MKHPAAYIANLNTYDEHGNPAAYDYAAVTLIRYEIDRLNDRLRYFSVELNETPDATLILSYRRNETDEPRRLLPVVENQIVRREIERIADEFGFFQIPRRPVYGEPDLNEIITFA